MLWQDIAAGAAASATGGAVAAFLAFKAAIARFRRERAFDKQLEWYEGAVQRLSATSQYLASIAIVQQTHGSFSESQIQDATVQGLKLLDLGREAELYASTEAYNSLTPVLNAAHDLTVLLTPEHLDPASPRHHELLETLRGTAYVLGEASSCLIDEARKRLKIPALRRRWSWSKEEDDAKLRRIKRLEDSLDSWASAEWIPLDLAVIERALTRNNHMLAPSERKSLAADLVAYAYLLDPSIVRSET